jgi:hypothetical protein
MNTRQNQKYSEMARLYEQGLSLSQIGAKYGVTRQSVYDGLNRRGVAFRVKKRLPTVEFDGLKFTVRSHGYYARTDGDRELMHRYVWRFHYGDIPAGHDIHHKNEIKTDNRIENLEMKTKADHSHDHSFQFVPLKNCVQCGRLMNRRSGEGPTAYRRRKRCSIACRGMALRKSA